MRICASAPGKEQPGAGRDERVKMIFALKSASGQHAYLRACATVVKRQSANGGSLTGDGILGVVFWLPGLSMLSNTATGE